MDWDQPGLWRRSLPGDEFGVVGEGAGVSVSVELRAGPSFSADDEFVVVVCGVDGRSGDCFGFGGREPIEWTYGMELYLDCSEFVFVCSEFCAFDFLGKK